MKNILLIVLFGLLLRLFAVFYFGNFKSDFYWEYGEIAKNILKGNGYSLFYIDNSKLEFHVTSDSNPTKSAYMPPGYTYFLLPFIKIDNVGVRNALIYLVQAIISTLVIFLIYVLTKKMFDIKTALLAAFISAVLPEFIYSCLSFTPTVIYQLLVVSILIVTFKLTERKQIYIYGFGVLLAITIYFRSEFILFGFIVFITFIFYKMYRQSVQIILIILILISPWIIRNIITFNEFVPLSTSFGLNLYRGNNPYNIGDWGDEKTNEEISKIKGDNLEVRMNNIFQDEAFAYILHNPAEVIKNIFVKEYYFWIINKNDKRTYNPAYLLPSVFLLIFFIYGTIKSFNWQKFKYLYLFIIYSNLIIVIFFPMLRYQSMMKAAIIPFCSFGILKTYYYIKSGLLKKA